jgi:hypothetical protein
VFFKQGLLLLLADLSDLDLQNETVQYFYYKAVRPICVRL